MNFEYILNTQNLHCYLTQLFPWRNSFLFFLCASCIVRKVMSSWFQGAYHNIKDTREQISDCLNDCFSLMENIFWFGDLTSLCFSRHLEKNTTSIINVFIKAFSCLHRSHLVEFFLMMYCLRVKANALISFLTLSVFKQKL